MAFMKSDVELLREAAKDARRQAKSWDTMLYAPADHIREMKAMWDGRAKQFERLANLVEEE